MKQDEKFVGVDWTMFGKYLPETLLEELEVEVNPNVERSSSPSSVSIHQQSLTNMDTTVSLKDPDPNDKQRQNTRNELVVRFLTAMSIDYEKQWYLGNDSSTNTRYSYQISGKSQRKMFTSVTMATSGETFSTAIVTPSSDQIRPLRFYEQMDKCFAI